MVKKTANLDKVTKFLTRSLLEEDIDIALILEEMLDLLVQNDYVKHASLINNEKNRIYHSKNLADLSIDDDASELEAQEIENWGTLYFKPGAKAEDLDWDSFSNNIALFIHSVELKVKSQLISGLTSEIRKTLRPDIALEKIYKGLEEFAQIDDFSFYKRLINTDEAGENLFKGYSLYFHNGDLASSLELSTETDSYMGQVLQQKEIRALKRVEPGNYTEIFSAKVRGREWGLLVIKRKTPWSDDLIGLIELFAEQMATVFNQH